MKPRRSQEFRVSERTSCDACGRPVAIGAVPLTWATLGDGALVHLECHQAYCDGKRTPKPGDVF